MSDGTSDAIADGIPVFVPRENNNDELVTLIKWHCGDGDEVAADQVVAEVEGSKATFEVVAPRAGVLRRVSAEGEDVPVGGVLCRVFSSRAAAESWRDAAAEVECLGAQGGEGGADGFVRFSKRAQALIEERGFESRLFRGRGLVRARDVLALAEAAAKPNAARRAAADFEWIDSSTEPSSSAGSSPEPSLAAPARRYVLTPSKRTEARYIAASHRSTLPSSVTVCVPTKGLKAAAAQSDALEGNVSAVLVYETARLLRKYPLFNGCYSNGDAYLYEPVNIGVAVDAGGGLKVPVIHAADTKSLAEISAALRESLVAYVNDELSAADQSGGTFTITDLSGLGVFLVEPLINKSQSAILGVGAEFFPAGRRDGFFNLTLRFDHQLAEGRMAASFLNDLAERLRGYEAALSESDGHSAHCTRCYRGYEELRELNHYLVQIVGADARANAICTGCLQGW